MWTQRRNKVKIYYADYLEKIPIRDDYGYLTGEHKSDYTEPKELWTHVTPNRGARESWQFGDDLNYDKLIFDTRLPIKEDSRLWVDNVDIFDENGAYNNTPHDYVVTRVGESLNQVQIAIERVNVRD